MARVLVLSYTDLGRDGRVDRQIGFLRAEHEVVAAGLGRPQHDVEYVDLRPAPASVAIRRARQAAGLTRLALRRHRATYWRNHDNQRIHERLQHVPFDVVLANDISSLPMAQRLARGRPLVLDAHEWAIEEQAEKRWWRVLLAPYVDRLVRDAAPSVTAAMTVSPGIADLYRERYGIECAVVTNAPAEAALEPSPVGRPLRVVHHGIAERARRIERMAEGVAAAGPGWELDLMLIPGDGAYLEGLRRAAARLPNVRMADPVAPREITAAINGHDVGVYMLEDRQVNQRLALPNKFFEFVQARLAVVVGPSPEMARLVREHGFGVVTEDFSAAALRRTLAGLTPEHVARMKAAAHRAAPALSATPNRRTVLGLVQLALDAER